MNYKIRISSLAKSHIKEAVSYYKKETSLKVAQNFVKDYEQTLQKIKFDLDVIKAERQRIDNALKERGFYYFDDNDLVLQVDSHSLKLH